MVESVLRVAGRQVVAAKVKLHIQMVRAQRGRLLQLGLRLALSAGLSVQGPGERDVELVAVRIERGSAPKFGGRPRTIVFRKKAARRA